MITEKERKNRGELFRLMQENPDLPVILMVDGELVGGDVFDTLESYCSYAEFDALPESDEECRKIYDALLWVKAIIVNIMKAVAMNCGNGISDLETFRRAVRFYFPGADAKFHMTVNLCADVEADKPESPPKPQAADQGEP